MHGNLEIFTSTFLIKHCERQARARRALLTGLILASLVVLFMEVGSPEQVLMATLTILWNLRIVSTEEALDGFSNSGLVSIGALFIVMHAVDKSRVVDYAARRILGSHLGDRTVLLRVCFTVFALSGFCNNTPLVVLFMPIVRDWARTNQRAPSTFLIPLSYAAIMGGMLTTIGTSTNLLVNGLLEKQGQLRNQFLFEVMFLCIVLPLPCPPSEPPQSSYDPSQATSPSVSLNLAFWVCRWVSSASSSSSPWGLWSFLTTREVFFEKCVSTGTIWWRPWISHRRGASIFDLIAMKSVQTSKTMKVNMLWRLLSLHVSPISIWNSDQSSGLQGCIYNTLPKVTSSSDTFHSWKLLKLVY